MKFIRMAAVCAALVLSAAAAGAQDSKNVIVVSNVKDKPTSYNDCWGFVGNNGMEYAIIGYSTGTLFYNVDDPANPVLVGDIPGSASSWRDMKTNGDYCYIVTEGASGGVQIVDLSDPENPFLANTWLPNAVHQAHNIFIDTATSRGYMVGCSNAGGNARGLRIADFGTDPVNPTMIGSWNFPNPYIHDIFVRNDTAWAGEINDQQFQVLDVSVPSAVSVIATQSYGQSSHATWLLDNTDDILITMDEQSGGRVRIWDVSNLASISQIANYEAGSGASVHNAFVKNDTVYISYYTEGLRVLDCTTPASPVEIGWYDTYAPAGGLFDGLWGTYPYLPSGTIIGSDIQSGLFLFQYIDGAGSVNGTVTDVSTTFPVPGVVRIPTSGLADSTDGTGDYTLGSAAGAVSLVTSAFGFVNDTSMVTIISDTIVDKDIALTAAPGASISGNVTDGSNNLLDVFLDIPSAPRSDFTDAGGNYDLLFVPAATHSVSAYKFGFDPDTADVVVTDGVPETQDFVLDPWFLADELEVVGSWTVGDINDSASTGVWEHADPNGTGGGAVQPEDDHTLGSGVNAWITGQSGIGADIGVNDVDGGATTLFSPIYDLTTLTNPTIVYHRWFTNDASANPGIEPWVVKISNDGGASWATVESTTVSAATWTEVSFLVSDFVTPTNQIQMKFVAKDDVGAVVEAGVDDFGILDDLTIVGVGGADETDIPLRRVELSQNRPNPFNPTTRIDFAVPVRGKVDLAIYTPSGRLVKTLIEGQLAAGPHTVIWNGMDDSGRDAASGVYLYRLEAGRSVQNRKLILVR